MEELDARKVGFIRAIERVVGYPCHWNGVSNHQAVSLVYSEVDFNKRGVCLEKPLID